MVLFLFFYFFCENDFDENISLDKVELLTSHNFYKKLSLEI